MRQQKPVFDAEPIISEANVCAALDGMIYSTAAKETSELERLWLVEVFLAAPEQPASPHNHRYALQTMLIDLITAELTRHRATVGFPTPIADEPLETVIERIGDDAGDSNIERIGWSWLYYRYVRVDLNLTVRDFCLYAHLDARTRQRYQKHAIRRLTERLIEAERDARRRLHKRRLYAALQSLIPVQLFGREQATRELNRLHRTEFVVQISGEVGIGKTTFVREHLRDLIDADKVAEIIWIDHPADFQTIRNRIAATLPVTVPAAARGYFAQYPTAIVIDDLTALSSDQAALSALLTELTGASVYLIHNEPLPSVTRQVILMPLSLAATMQLIRHLEATQFHTFGTMVLSEDEIGVIWKESSGIPGAILLEMRQLTIKDNE